LVISIAKAQIFARAVCNSVFVQLGFLPLLRRPVEERAGERREPLSLSLSPLRGARGSCPEPLAKN
jgi:hypothetical protein